MLKLLPTALAGFALALFVDKLVPPAGFRHLMGGCLLFGCMTMIGNVA